MLHSARATSEIPKRGRTHPEWEARAGSAGSSDRAGPVARPTILAILPAGHQCARGAHIIEHRTPRSVSPDARKECANSPAQLPGALRGIPAEGVAGNGKAAPAQGKAFPHGSRQIASSPAQVHHAICPFAIVWHPVFHQDRHRVSSDNFRRARRAWQVRFAGNSPCPASSSRRRIAVSP